VLLVKVTRARIIAGIAGWLLLLSPLLLEPKGKSAFASGVLSTGISGLFVLGTWRFMRFVRTRFRAGRRRTVKTTGKITARHVEKVYENGGYLARWVTTVSYPTGTGKQERIEWAPYDAYTNMESTVNRVGERNPLGKEVVVHVDPNDPSNASVRVRMSWVLYPCLALGALALTVSLVIFVPLSGLFVVESFLALWRSLT
jgi:hypothetical protein